MIITKQSSNFNLYHALDIIFFADYNSIMMKCNICPRNCNIDRSIHKGYCKSEENIHVSKVMLHKWEEPCISGPCECINDNIGSGTIFFSGCNLRCIYCQNYDISQLKSGKKISIETLVSIFKQLENKGAYNINLVTPTHYTEQIIKALKIYKPSIPVIWNSSGYEKVETLKKLEGLIDIYLMDFKYFDETIAKELSLAPNYPSNAKSCLLECKRQIPNNIFDKNGLMKKGIIVRHLCLPTYTDDSKNIVNWINENLGNKTILSIMSQYVPMHKALSHPKINRKLKPIEYKIVVSHLQKLGFSNAYIQDFDSQSTDFTPNFQEDCDDYDY